MVKSRKAERRKGKHAVHFLFISKHITHKTRFVPKLRLFPNVSLAGEFIFPEQTWCQKFTSTYLPLISLPLIG